MENTKNKELIEKHLGVNTPQWIKEKVDNIINEALHKNKVNFSVVHCKKSPYDVYIGRPSKWSNPFTHKQDGKTLAKYVVSSRNEAIAAYREWITNGEGKYLMNDLHELKNKVLGCWCKPQSCHGDVLLELVAKHCLDNTKESKQKTDNNIWTLDRLHKIISNVNTNKALDLHLKYLWDNNNSKLIFEITGLDVSHLMK